MKINANTTVRTLWYPLALGLVVLSAYWQAPEGSYHYDDRANITQHEPVKMEELSLDALRHATRNPAMRMRPLPSLTFAFDWWRGGGSPRPFLWTNVAIHLLGTIAVYWLFLLVLGQVGWDRCNGLAAFLGSLLWSVHPINVQAVAYIVQRMASMAALFVVLSVSFYIRGRTTTGRSTPWFVLSGATLLLGALTKENAWMGPLLLILAEFGVVRHGKIALGNRLDRLLAALPVTFLGMAAVLTYLRSWPIERFLAEYKFRDFTLIERLLTQPRVIAFHLSQIVWPDPDRFSLIHEPGVSGSLLDPPSTLISLLAVLAWIGLFSVLLTRPRFRVVGFFGLWVPLMLLTESSVIPLEMVYEHRMYLPSVGIFGLCALAMGLVERRESKWRWGLALVVCGCLAACLVVSTRGRVKVWENDLTLWTDAVATTPHSARAHNNLGKALWDSGLRDDAVQNYEAAITIEPKYREATLNLARSYGSLGQIEKAEVLYREATAEHPLDADVRFSYGIFLLDAGRLGEARDKFVSTLLLDPGHGQASLFLRYIDSQRAVRKE